MNPPTVRRLAPHEKTQIAPERGRALPPDAHDDRVRRVPDASELATPRREPPREAPTTVRPVPEPARRQAPVEAPTTVRRVPEHVRQAPIEAPTTVRPVPEHVRHAPIEAPTTVRSVPEDVRQAPIEAPTTVRRVGDDGPTTVRRADGRPAVRMHDEAPTTVRPVPSLAAPIPGDLPERPSRFARGSFPSPLPQPPAHVAQSAPPAAQPAPVAAKPAAKAPAKQGAKQPAQPGAKQPGKQPAKQPTAASAKPAAAAPAKQPAAAPAQTPAAAKPVTVPAPVEAAPVEAAPAPAPAADAPAARPSTPATPAELARGSQPPPQQLSPEVFALIRRIALQQNLTDAAGVLHAGLANLVNARVVLAQISDADAISSPVTAELRDAAKLVPLGLVAETSRRRQRFTADRLVLVPLPTSSRAVLVVWRKPDAPPLDPEAIRTATAVATRLGVLDHFLAAAAEKLVREEADKKSLFRPEALAASRETRKDGQLVDLSPRILRIAIPAILAIATVLVIAAAIVQVPTYSRGTIVVKANGHNVISNSSGRIARVLVTPGQQVRAGDPVIELDTTNEQQVFAQIDTNYRDQLSTFLFDTTDEAARTSLAGILAQRKGARDALVAKTITAPVDGAVTDVLVTDIVNAGEHVATIIPEGSQPSVVAFMPGSDRSRFAPGMTMQIELAGYPGSRLKLTITEVGTDIMGSSKARKLLGEKLADAVALPPSVVLVKAALPPGGFTSRGKTYSFFDGMDGLAEIEIEKRSFLSVVIPTGD